jgi:hypothetical protein
MQLVDGVSRVPDGRLAEKQYVSKTLQPSLPARAGDVRVWGAMCQSGLK